jgi:hypothetical protein
VNECNTTYIYFLQTISSSPWNIEGKHLILKHWIPGIPPHDLDFSTTIFWIQVHNLPIDYMTTENAKLISAHLETLHKIDLNEKGSISMGKYLRLRVEIEAYAPLKCGFLMDQSPLSDTWFDFKYERLSDFCFHCGRLGHLQTECHFEPPTEQDLKWDVGPKGYGPWLQADPTEQKSSRLKEIISGPRNTTQDYEARVNQTAAQPSQNHLLRDSNLHHLHKASPSSLPNIPTNPRSELLHPHQTPLPSPSLTITTTDSQIYVPITQTSTQITNPKHQNLNQAAITPPQTIVTTDLLLTVNHTNPQNPTHDPSSSPLATATTVETGMFLDQQTRVDSHATLDLGIPTNHSDTKYLSDLPTHNPLLTTITSTDSAKTHLTLEIPHRSDPNPHLAHTSHPTFHEDPNHTLTEAFVLFRMGHDHLKSLAESSLGSNRAHISPWAKLNQNGPNLANSNYWTITQQAQPQMPNPTPSYQAKKEKASPPKRRKPKK